MTVQHNPTPSASSQPGSGSLVGNAFRRLLAPPPHLTAMMLVAEAQGGSYSPPTLGEISRLVLPFDDRKLSVSAQVYVAPQAVSRFEQTTFSVALDQQSTIEEFRFERRPRMTLFRKPAGEKVVLRATNPGGVLSRLTESGLVDLFQGESIDASVCKNDTGHSILNVTAFKTFETRDSLSRAISAFRDVFNNLT
ncbi:MAG: hypothetical protein KDD64_01490 [Bdellovibrionales bacterium]|nr:hypothetical protein [Bdellovibrionales bacterium]